jgi:flagellar hook-associated protein 1 FlgK
MAGLQTAQAGMLVTSQNVTGSSVEGYVRRTSHTRITALSPSSYEITGTSFAVEGFTRQFNGLLQSQLLAQTSQTSYSKTLAQSVSTLDAMLADGSTSIANAMGAFFNAAGSLANEPTNQAYQQAFTGTARQLADRIRSTSTTVDSIATNAKQALTDVLNQANTLAPQLASVNAKIRGAAVPGMSYPSADLLDERDRITQKLQDLIGGTTTINEDGTASYQVSGQFLVDREIANKFTNVSGTTPVDASQSIYGVQLMVTSRNNTKTPMFVQNAQTGEYQSAFVDGQAGAYVHLIDKFVPTVKKSLNLLAVQLLEQTNEIQNSDNVTVSPIFAFAGIGSGADITDPNAAVIDRIRASGGSRAYDAILDQSNPDSSAFNSTLQTYLEDPNIDASLFKATSIFNSTQFANMDAQAATAIEALRSNFSNPVTYITASIATTVATWRNNHSANEAVQEALVSQKEAVSGVNLDEEAANLVKFQQLYNASSKIIQTGKQMFDTLLAMLSGN